MKRKQILLSSALILAFLLVLPVYAQPPLFDELEGWKINIYNGRPYPTPPPGEIDPVPIPVSEPTFICHGWTTGGEAVDHWDGMSIRQKLEFLFTARFRLFIDGKPIKLRRYIWYGYNPQLDHDELYMLFWIQFEPYTFEPGFHRFTGIWSLRVNGEWIVELKSWDILFVDTPP